MSHQFETEHNGRRVKALRDILPTGAMKMLIVGETPVEQSIAAGHYFQGRHGRYLWSKLKELGILSVPAGAFEDDQLVSQGYGITDVVKITDPPGREPYDAEYKKSLPSFFNLLHEQQPKILLFVYKRVLDTILRIQFGRPKAWYGFYPDPDNLFPCKVFVFCMMGTPCDSHTSSTTLNQLVTELHDLK